MANEEHLAILKQGVEAWNQWRREDRGSHRYAITVDLRKADLKGVPLMGVDLRGAYLEEADLSHAHLCWGGP